jgi:hypothetical protein
VEAPGAAMIFWHCPQPWLKDVDEDAQQMPDARKNASKEGD